MNSFLQSEVFFFISSVSVVFITALLLVLIMYAINILRDIRKFFNTIQRGTEALSEDISEIRAKLSDKGVWTGFLLSIITAVSGFRKKANESKRSKK
ncbi:MAG: hypothetical protein KAS07_01115 [Candidatus Pacebacteria bacterium]|nr:hypothetical protein [Candidatus Paceibacterota bacterium]